MCAQQKTFLKESEVDENNLRGLEVFCLLLLAFHCVFGQVSSQEVETSSPLHLPYREVGVIN